MEYGATTATELVNRNATAFLRAYMSEYGLGPESSAVELATPEVFSIDAMAGGGGVMLLGIFELFVDGVVQEAFTVSVMGAGATAERAQEELANHATDMVGDPLIAYLGGSGFDFQTARLGGYGFTFVSIFGNDEDLPALRAFTSDLGATARSVLGAVEPILLERVTASPREYAPGEPIDVLQLGLIGTDTSADGRVTASAFFDETGELSRALNENVDWPDVRGIYSISLVYGLR
jgi:hypothetical protein